MKVYKSPWTLLIVMILPFCLAACYPEPEFSVVPEINFESVSFKEGDIFDTLVIRVKFQDGDGDMGLGGEEDDPPYHPFNPQPKPNGDPCFYSDRFNTTDCPGLPLEYNCNNYIPPPVRVGEELVNDTLYVEYNENYHNFLLDVMTKENGQFEVFDFRGELCTAPLSGRFPRLKEDFGAMKPIEGVIEFKAPSSAYFALFRNDTLKLRIRIKDRALHDSNIVESCEFTLNELLEGKNCTGS